ncbi:hypothetical protein MC885_000345 [Smutsia gigantea]|nr:hypothetical protein MC885_000345 [Smutsia gigantea]
MLHVEMLTLVFLVLWMCVFSQDPSSKAVADRYAVYWNSSNPSRNQESFFSKRPLICSLICMKTLLETVTIQAGDRGPLQGPEGRVQAIPQDTQSTADPCSRESVGPKAETGKQSVDDESLCGQ